MKNILRELKLLSTSQFGKNTFYVYLTQVVGGAFGFILNLILLRKLNVYDYGLFSLYSSAAMLLGGLLHFSWVETYSRFGAMHINDPIFPSVSKFFVERVAKSVLVIGIIFFIFSGLISDSLYHRPNFGGYFRLAILNGALLTFTSFFSVDMQNKHQFKKLFYMQVFQNLSRLLLVLGFILIAYFSLQSVISVYVFVPLMFGIYYSFTIGLNTKTFWNAEELSPDLRAQTARFRNWSFLAAISNQLIGNIDLSVMAHFHPDQVLAQYGAAARLTLPLNMAISAISMVLLPKIASTKDPDVTRKQLRKMVKYLIPTGLVFFALSFLLPSILSRWAGAEYLKSQNVIQYFLFSSIIVFITNPAGIFLIAWGHVRMNAALNLAQLIVDVALDLLWIPKYGALGAIQATCVVHLMGMFFAYYQLYRALQGKLKPHHHQ